MRVLESNPMDGKRAIWSAVILSALGAMFYNLLPLFLGVAQDYRELNNTVVGLLSSLFFAGFTLTMVTAFFWIRLFNWRVVTTVALGIGCLALLLAGYTDSKKIMMLCMFVAGGAFSAVYGIGTTALGDTINPARWYGLKFSSEAMLGAILLFLLPGTLISEHGFIGLMIGMVLAVVLLAPALRWLPEAGYKKEFEKVNVNEESHIPLKRRLGIWMALFAVVLFMFSATMVWAFVERMASTAGFEPVLAGKVLSLTLGFAVLGSMTAVVMGNRFGSGKPFSFSVVVYLLALVWLSDIQSLTEYAIGACLLTYAIGLGVTYVITIVADLDTDGRFVVLTVPAFGIGIMIAPVIGGLLTSSYGFEGLFMVGGITAVLSFLAGLVASRNGRLIFVKPINSDTSDQVNQQN